MSVKVGHASIDERGKASGGKAGDQNGKEVCTRSWYLKSQGWWTLRCKVPGMAEYIARAMEIIVTDPDVGYDQSQNQTLWKLLDENGFDVRNINKAVETDCARLVRVCVQWAAMQVGLDVVIPDFYTATEASVLVGTGLFEKLTSDKYNKQDAYLERGMLQVTRGKGHTWVILSNGSKASSNNFSGTVTVEPEKTYKLGERILKNGMEGTDVKELQELLLELNKVLGKKRYDLGEYGTDGDYGDCTEIAVKKFQKDYGCDVDGEVGPQTLKALYAAFEGSDAIVVNPKKVQIVGGNCNVRRKPDTSGSIIDVAKNGTLLEYLGEKSDDGWHKVKIKNEEGWVSGKYSKLVAA